MIFSKKGKKILTVIAILAVLSTVFLNFVSAEPAAAALTDYITDSYEGVGTGHIFDSVTYERLVRILRSDGKSIILLGSPVNATSQATLKIINETAKDYGIKKIYLFDPHLGGANGVDITNTGKPYVQFWNTLRAYTAGTGGGALLKYLNSAYTSDDTALLVYDRKAGGDTVADSANTISKQLIIKNRTDVTSDINAFKTRVEDVFSAVGTKGAANETRYTQFDYFKTAFSAANPKVDAYSQKEEDFRLVEVTYPELIHILQAGGAHTILISGSWCPDSRAAIGYISENAARYKSEPIYVFDFRLDGSLGIPTTNPPYSFNGVDYTSSSLSVLAAESQSKPTGTGYLGAKIVDLLGGYHAGYANVAGNYFTNGDPAQPLVQRSNINFRSPFLIQYNKDATDLQGKPAPVVKEWIHRLADYEKPWHANAVNGDYPEGAYIDYELSSGELNASQKALGRAGIGTFFSGSELSYKAPGVPNISETDSELDSGCGDDNDPIDNLYDDNLIPNHGTAGYDVRNYDISIQFDPDKINDLDSFTGTAVIKATANEKLNALSFDFRQLPLSATPVVKNTTLGENIVITSVDRINKDEEDTQKLILNLQKPINAHESFEVTVAYTTGTIEAYVAGGKSPQGFSKSINGTGAAAIGEPFGSTYWFPNNNTPKDGASYKITLIAPSAYASVSNGVRTGNANNQPATGLRTRVWEVTQDTAPYQIFASFSNDYTELNGSAASKVTLTDGTELDTYVYANKTIYDRNSNRSRDKVDTFYNKLPYYIRQLERIGGKYPGESVGFVFDNLSDGKGGSAQWGAVETKDRPFYTGTNITDESVFVHEMAHQWFGDAVRLANWKSLWLNEGFATYATDLFYENTKGVSSIEKYKKLYEKNSGSALWKTAPADIKRETDLFGGAKVAYNRGALALAALRVAIGDEDFFDLLHEWVSRYKGQAAVTSDFTTLAKEISGINLDSFFQTWIYSTEKPAYFPTVRLLADGTDPSLPSATPTVTATPTSTGTVSTPTPTVTSNAGPTKPIVNKTAYIPVSKVKISKVTGTVKAANKLTVYKKASTKKGKITILRKGKTVVVKSVSGDYAKVKVGKKYGYVKVTGLQFNKKQNGQILANTKAYKAAAANQGYYKQLSKNSRVTLNSRYKSYYRITVRGRY